MEGIQSCAPTCRGAVSPASIQFQGEAARLAYLNICEDRSADINILTSEGDKVTLCSDYHAEGTLLTYEHLAYSNSGGETESGQLLEFSEELDISLSVEGELNDQELADIQALLSDLGRMLKAFLTGKSEGKNDEENSRELGRYGTLAAFEADFEYNSDLQYLSLAADQLTVEAAGSPQLLEPMPASPATILKPTASIASSGAETVQTAAPAAAAETSSAKRPVVPAVPIPAALKAAAPENDHAASAMTGKVRQSGLQPRRLMKLLRKFLRGLMKELHATHAIDAEQAKRGENILEKFFDQLEKPSSIEKIKATKVSMKQQWVSLQYELKAEVQVQPGFEKTA
jgi:hypothetical protein